MIMSKFFLIKKLNIIKKNIKQIAKLENFKFKKINQYTINLKKKIIKFLSILNLLDFLVLIISEELNSIEKMVIFRNTNKLLIK